MNHEHRYRIFIPTHTPQSPHNNNKKLPTPLSPTNTLPPFIPIHTIHTSCFFLSLLKGLRANFWIKLRILHAKNVNLPEVEDSCLAFFEALLTTFLSESANLRFWGVLLTAEPLIWYHSRFFVRVGHEITYATIKNHHFFH